MSITDRCPHGFRRGLPCNQCNPPQNNLDLELRAKLDDISKTLETLKDTVSELLILEKDIHQILASRDRSR